MFDRCLTKHFNKFKWIIQIWARWRFKTTPCCQFFERALSFDKPFALIMTNTWLNDSTPKILFKDKDLQLLMFDKRMEFNQSDGKVNNKITFSSSYYCWNFLPKQIIMKELIKPKVQTVPAYQVSQDMETPLTRLL